MAATILHSVQANGGRTSRYGEFTMVFMHNCGFITTPMEYMQMQNWARGRVSTGNPNRDRTLFIDRFETVLGRGGSGVATRGSKAGLLRIVKAMESTGILLEEWLIPRDLADGVEVKKKPAEAKVATGTGTFAASTETLPH
jgi:hypothetical protein